MGLTKPLLLLYNSFTDVTKQDANYENAESKSLRVHEDGHHTFFKYAARDYRILSMHAFAWFLFY